MLMPDRLRPILYHLFVASILAGLWFYADLERRVAESRNLRLPAVAPTPGIRSCDDAERVASGPATRPVRAPVLSGLGGAGLLVD